MYIQKSESIFRDSRQMNQHIIKHTIYRFSINSASRVCHSHF